MVPAVYIKNMNYSYKYVFFSETILQVFINIFTLPLNAV